MHSWGISPARGLHRLVSPSSIQFIAAYTYKACTVTQTTSNVPVCWCCCRFPLPIFFLSLVSGCTCHVIVFVVLKHFPPPKKKWSYLTTSLYSLVFHEPGEIGCESTKCISASSQSLPMYSREDVFQPSLFSRPLCTTHTHTYTQNVEDQEQSHEIFHS